MLSLHRENPALLFRRGQSSWVYTGKYLYSFSQFRESRQENVLHKRTFMTHTHTHFYTILVSGDPSLGIPQGFKVFLSVLPQMWFLSLNLEKLCLLKTLLSSQTATLIVCINCYGGEQFWSWSFDPKKQINKWTTKRWSPATAAQSGSVCFSYDCLNAASLMLTCLSEIGSSVRLVLRLHPPPPLPCCVFMYFCERLKLGICVSHTVHWIPANSVVVLNFSF